MLREMTYLGKKKLVEMGPPFLNSNYTFTAGGPPIKVDGQDVGKMVGANPKMFLVGKPIFEGSAHEAEIQPDEDELIDADEVAEKAEEEVPPVLILVDTDMNGYSTRLEIMEALDKIAEAYPDVDASYQGNELRANLEEKLLKAIEAVKDLDPDQSIIKV